MPGHSATYRFENWELSVENGLFTRIPDQQELPTEYQNLPVAYTTCRIFRWAACILPNLVQGNAISSQDLFLNS
jgi:hypothetical protein